MGLRLALPPSANHIFAISIGYTAAFSMKLKSRIHRPIKVTYSSIVIPELAVFSYVTTARSHMVKS